VSFARISAILALQQSHCNLGFMLTGIAMYREGRDDP
jgi:hypothetical protein